MLEAGSRHSSQELHVAGLPSKNSCAVDQGIDGAVFKGGA
jgi:hypothetical protein